MVYVPTNWSDNVTPANAANMNKIEAELVALDVRPGTDLSFDGDWAAGTYQEGDTVVQNGVLFMCVGGPTSTPPDTSLWGSFTPGTNIGTSLPASPVDGQRFILVDSLITPTYNWEFQYVAGITDAYKWICTGQGGAGALVEVATSEVIGSNGAYVALATAGPSFTIPRAGIYDVSVGCKPHSNGATNNMLMSYDIGGTAAVDADATEFELSGSVSNGPPGSRVSRKTFATAAITLVSKYKTDAGSGSSSFKKRWMSIVPLRVA